MAQSRWRVVLGPLTTLATVVAVYLVDRYIFPVPNPGAISFVAVVFSAYFGGLSAGLVSAIISLGYAAFSFSIPGQFLHYKPENLARLYVLMIATPAIAVMVGLLQARMRRALARERKALVTVEASNGDLAALRAALDQADYGILLLDRELRAQFINRTFRKIWRLPDHIADSKPAYVALLYHGRDTRAYAVQPDVVDAHVAARAAAVRAGDERPVDLMLTNGDVVCVRCKALPEGGRMLTYATVTARVNYSHEMEELATLDGMTGLYNRRHFFVTADGEWGRFQRYQRPLSLLMVDIDLFKTVNDSYGHDVGDRVIVQIADACRENKRTSDVIARVGGNEFALLLPETALDDAEVVAERLRQSIATREVPGNGRAVNVTVSIGVAEANHQMIGVTDLIKQADMALYAAKRAGRNRTCIYEEAAEADGQYNGHSANAA
jgi:diguanylate cyclase (GGDEF)-like protein